MPPRATRLCLLLACLATPALAQEQTQSQVIIYRCADAKGHLTFQDAPCPKGNIQSTREMVRPKDPPPRTAPAPAIAPEPARASEPPRVIVLRTPQPLYECVRPDNSVYTSDNGDGNPRYVSYYDLDDGRWSWPRGGSWRDHGGRGEPGYTQVTPPPTGIPRGSGPTNSPGFTPVTPPLVGIPQGTRHMTLPPRPIRPPQHPDYGYGYGYVNVLVRDECHPLPQAEVCARLRDRRDDIRDRFFNAQETERARLSKEERGINARLAADCGGA